MVNTNNYMNEWHDYVELTGLAKHVKFLKDVTWGHINVDGSTQ